MELKCFIWHIVNNHRIIGWENVFKSVRLIKIMSAFHNNAIIQYFVKFLSHSRRKIKAETLFIFGLSFRDRKLRLHRLKDNKLGRFD